jgi:hypothetical protein
MVANVAFECRAVQRSDDHLQPEGGDELRQRSAAATAARAGRSGAMDTPAPFLERVLGAQT